jgi:hypothetical protein
MARYADGERRPLAGRRRRGAAAGARRGAYGIARVIDLIVAGVVVVLVAGILLVVLKANPGNDIVSAVTDAAKFLAGPFDGMFSLDNPRTEIAVNWGVAAAVYFVVGRLVTTLLRRA